MAALYPVQLWRGYFITGEADDVEKSGGVVTDDFVSVASIALELCQRLDIETAILTESSPSCGSTFIYDGSFSGNRVSGMGVTAALLRRNGVKIFIQYQIEEAGRAINALNE